MSLNLPPGITPLTGSEVAWIAASYAIGCFTAGYYWTRWTTGRDIRHLGSGNVGARNVGRNFGPGGFTVTLLLDLLKGAIAVTIAARLGMRPEAVVGSLVAVIAGHNWPMQLRFQGGKGIAVSLGAMLAFDPLMVGCVLLVFAPLMAMIRNFTLSGLLAFALGPLVAFSCGLDKVEVAALSFVAILALLTHLKNIRQEIARLGVGRVEEAPLQMHKRPHDEV